MFFLIQNKQRSFAGAQERKDREVNTVSNCTLRSGTSIFAWKSKNTKYNRTNKQPTTGKQIGQQDRHAGWKIIESKHMYYLGSRTKCPGGEFKI